MRSLLFFAFIFTSVYGGLRAQTGKPQNDSVYFKHLDFDFGTIFENERHSHNFEFVNHSSTPVNIITAFATCNCTTLDYKTTPVQPGEVGKIVVIFDTKGKLGKITREVEVHTSFGKFQLVITANVLKNKI